MPLVIKKNNAPAPAPKTVSGVAHASVENKDGAVLKKVAEEPIPVHIPAGEDVAHIEVSIGLTRNLGNYESVRINVGITLPCPANAEAIDATYMEAKGWVDSRIEQINEEVSQELGS